MSELLEIGTALAINSSELEDFEENHQGITGVSNSGMRQRDIHIPKTHY